MPVIATPQPPNPVPGPAGIVATPVALPQNQYNLLTAQAILNAIIQAQLTNPQGVIRINIDGQEAVFASRAQLDDAYLFWSNRVAILSNKKRRANNVDLSIGP